MTLADIGFDGDWVSPIQKISNSRTGPVLVAKHWLDAESADRNRAILECLGYLPCIPFNRVLDRSLKSVGLTRDDIYITQACHFLPRDDRQQRPPVKLMKLSIEEITRFEVENRSVIALGRCAQGSCQRAGVPHIKCVHPSARGATNEDKAIELAEALAHSIAG